MRNSFWENMGYVALALTIIGQILIGWSYLVGQGCWLISNLIYVARNVKLERPKPDMVKDSAMSALTTGLIIFYLVKGF